MEKSSTVPRLRRSRFTSIRLTDEERDALDELAARNERTLAGEVRLAIRAHLAKQEPAATPPLARDGLETTEV